MTEATKSPPRNAAGFNYTCLAVVFLVALALILRPIWNEKKHHDFGQFYMGATMARLGEWSAIYPEPVPTSNVNPGWPRGSTMKPAYAAAAAERGVDNTFRYIQLPPNALLYYPLALLSVQNAYRLWHAVMICFIVITAALAGQIYDAMRGGDDDDGRRSIAAGLVTLLVGCSPLMIYTARVSNTGPLLSACFGAAILGMLRPERRRPWGTALGVTIGGMTKYAPGVLVPVLFSM
ncbi:MAG TPA: glycosyltransferase 87 family protein, partial [Tepidisphaeraceae bacterium]|nr:glycosyltransferase 87 family protein [Tepidisphaeraceae bacterium]